MIYKKIFIIDTKFILFQFEKTNFFTSKTPERIILTLIINYVERKLPTTGEN